MQTSQNPKEYKCTAKDCKAAYPHRSSLRFHLETMHLDYYLETKKEPEVKGEFKCKIPKCLKRFTRNQNLKKHMLNCHPKVAPTTPITAVMEESHRGVLLLIKVALMMRFIRCQLEFGKIPKFSNGQLEPFSNSNFAPMKDTEIKPQQQAQQLQQNKYRPVTSRSRSVLDQLKEYEQQLIEAKKQADKEPQLKLSGKKRLQKEPQEDGCPAPVGPPTDPSNYKRLSDKRQCLKWVGPEDFEVPVPRLGELSGFSTRLLGNSLSTNQEQEQQVLQEVKSDLTSKRFHHRYPFNPIGITQSLQWTGISDVYWKFKRPTFYQSFPVNDYNFAKGTFYQGANMEEIEDYQPAPAIFDPPPNTTLQNKRLLKLLQKKSLNKVRVNRLAEEQPQRNSAFAWEKIRTHQDIINLNMKEAKLDLLETVREILEEKANDIYRVEEQSQEEEESPQETSEFKCRVKPRYIHSIYRQQYELTDEELQIMRDSVLESKYLKNTVRALPLCQRYPQIFSPMFQQLKNLKRDILKDLFSYHVASKQRVILNAYFSKEEIQAATLTEKELKVTVEPSQSLYRFTYTQYFDKLMLFVTQQLKEVELVKKIQSAVTSIPEGTMYLDSVLAQIDLEERKWIYGKSQLISKKTFDSSASILRYIWSRVRVLKQTEAIAIRKLYFFEESELRNSTRDLVTEYVLGKFNGAIDKSYMNFLVQRLYSKYMRLQLGPSNYIYIQLRKKKIHFKSEGEEEIEEGDKTIVKINLFQNQDVLSREY